MAICEGILSNGNQCTNEISDGEGHLIDGKLVCRYCKGRHTKAKKALRKKASAAEKLQREQAEKASFDPEEPVTCGAKPSCHNTMRHGDFNDKTGAKAMNPKVLARLAREVNNEAAKKVARMFLKRLSNEPPFVVCADCRQKLEKLWGQPEFLYLDLAYAKERYEERMTVERKKAEKEERLAEAKAEARRKAEEEEKRLSEELEEMRRKTREAEMRQQEAILDDFLPDGFEEDEEEPDVEETSDSKEEELSPSDQWLLRVGLGRGDSLEFPFRPLHLIENNEVVECDNPHCRCQGNILNNARNESGELILRHNSEDPIALFWGAFMRTNAHYTRGYNEGEPIIDRDGNPADAKSLVLHCNECGRRMRYLAFHHLLEKYKSEGMSYEDSKRRANIEAPLSSQLRDLVVNALRKKRERDEAESIEGSNGSSRRGPRQPNGRTRQDTPRHGTASPQEIGDEMRRLSGKASGVSVKLPLSHLDGNGS